jgi:hypothetical protein
VEESSAKEQSNAKLHRQCFQAPLTFGRKAGQNDPGGHWVTINGKHVFIEDAKAKRLDDPIKPLFRPSPSGPVFDREARQSHIELLDDPVQLPVPPSLRPPGVDQNAWERNVEQTKISDSLGTVHDPGLIIFGETQSYSDRSDSNEPIEKAREEMAHSILNADEKWGFDRPKWASTHGAIEPSENALKNKDVRAAYESSMKAAREAFLSGSDPTNGAVYAIANKTASRSNHVFTGPQANPEGVPISTQAGPYNNSYTGRDMHSRTAWLNTYYYRK